jgi:hypothetical protein
MKLATTAKILATGLALLILVVDVAANDPIFVKWLVIDDPGDETIRTYWERAEAGELSPEALVDLGTMLFYRGWPGDAEDYFRQALDADPELSDAWFRIGLVKHYSGDLSGARSAYKKCLKLQSGHAWCNFYLGLLEEQTGEPKSAMEHYEKAFQHAPGLADPKINPEILSSKLQLGAQVRHFDRERFEKSMPMPVLEPETMRQVRRQFKPEPEPSPTPVPTPLIGMTPTEDPERGGTGAQGAAGARNAGTRRSSGPTASGAAAGGAAGASASRSRGGASGTTSQLPDAGSTPYGFPTPPPDQGGAGSGEGGATPQIGDTSPEASLRPVWPGLYAIAEFFV